MNPGLTREPKWGHIRDLHTALNLCQKALLWGIPSVEELGKGLEVRVYKGVLLKFLLQ